MNDNRNESQPVSSGAVAPDPVDARVIAPLRRARLEPDDLQVARLSATLDAALRDDAAAPPARARGPARRAWLALAGGSALAAAAIAVLIAAPSLRRPPPDVGPARKPLPIAHEAGTTALAPRPLVVPAGSREQGRIGERVRFTLVGPGEISAFAAADGAELELASGRLLVDYDGHSGETLRVRSPGAVTTVVGTLFAVEAHGPTSRVAVARGSVTVEGSGARRRQLSAGLSWHTEAIATEPISADLAADLAALDLAVASPPPGHVADGAGASPSAAQPASVRPRPRPRPPACASCAEAEYAAAEELMRAGSTTTARKALLDIVAAHPGDPRAELALLDLARLALAAGRPMEARGYVARILASTKDDALIALARQVQRRIDAATAPTPAPPRDP